MGKEDDIKRLAESVGHDWRETPYYDEAEPHAPFFWNPAGPVRPLFDRLPAGMMLDLACGAGRHVARLLEFAEKLIATDINPENIQRCRERFEGERRLTLRVGNGYDFKPLKKESVSAIVSYDSMVHFDPDVVRSYLFDTPRVLAPGGMALFHHSNYSAAPTAEYYGDNPGARNFMSKELFAHWAAKSGMRVLEQVTFEWDHEPDLDCVTLLQK